MSDSNFKRFYVYIHRSKDNNAIFYVGKGCARRAWKSENRNLYWHRTVQKHGLDVEIVQHHASAEDALDHERFLIASLKALRVKLVNMTDGGDGLLNPSAETRAKLAAAGRRGAGGMRGRTHTEETKVILGKARSEQTAPVMSAAGRAALSAQRVGINNPFHGKTHKKETLELWKTARPTGGKHPRASGVLCVDTGQTFPSMADAARWLISSGATNKARSCDISAACVGKQKSAYGHRWQYLTTSHG